MIYKPTWDLTTIPDPVFNSERGRRNQAKQKVHPKVVIKPCSHCGLGLTSRQRRAACVNCGKHQAKGNR